MKLVSKSLLAAAVATAVFLSFCGAAGAAIVTLGPNLSQPFVSESCEETCDLLNLAVSQPGARVMAPAEGVIVRWSVVGGTTPGEYHLRVANRVEPRTFQFASTSPGVQSTSTPGIQTFNLAAPIPIKKGQELAVELSQTASIGFAEGIGSLTGWAPPVPDGTTKKGEILGPEEVAGYNAEMQPVPTVTGLTATSGISTGGTSVVIAGTDFEGTSAVSFGGVPASFAINSESQLTAVAPPGTAGAVVPVTVTTIAGTATSPANYTYNAPPVYCVVPNLVGKKLAAAKAALIKGECKVGTLKKLDGATSKNGKVTKQGAKVGVQLPVGSKVDLTLKPIRPTTKKPAKKQKHGHQ